MELTLIKESSIQSRIIEMANEINKDYKDRDDLVFVCVLRGAFLFFSDLVRQIDLDIEIEFIQASSYENNMTNQGLTIKSSLSNNIENKVVFIVDDIIDSGNTMNGLSEIYKNLGAKEVKKIALVCRPSSLKMADYHGFSIGDEWIFGYGLDLKGKRRTIKDIKYIELNLD
jgi:hypoxanthine phosphoribosyltransferase